MLGKNEECPWKYTESVIGKYLEVHAMQRMLDMQTSTKIIFHMQTSRTPA